MFLTVSPTPAHSHSLLQYMLNAILCMFSVTWTVYVEMYLPVWVWLTVAPLHSLSTLWHVHRQPHQPVSMACSMECRHVAPVVDYWRERGKNEILHFTHVDMMLCVRTLWYVGYDRCVRDREYCGHPSEPLSTLLLLLLMLLMRH